MRSYFSHKWNGSVPREAVAVSTPTSFAEDGFSVVECARVHESAIESWFSVSLRRLGCRFDVCEMETRGEDERHFAFVDAVSEDGCIYSQDQGFIASS